MRFAHARFNQGFFTFQPLVTGICHFPDAASAAEFFEEWYAWAIRSRLKPVKRVARMLKWRLKHLLSWFRHSISNATAEGFNSRIQSNARGFRNFANYRTLFFCEN